jgi:integrase
MEHVLKESVLNQSNNFVADKLVQPILEWKRLPDNYDIIGRYEERLKIGNKSKATILNYLKTAKQFVGYCGVKKDYDDDEVERYLGVLRGKYTNNNTYFQECVKLLQFLRNIPGADKHRGLPVNIRRPSDSDINRHEEFTLKEIKKIIEFCAYGSQPKTLESTDIFVFLVSSIYGARTAEIIDLMTNYDTCIDFQNYRISIPRLKKGERRWQPIPRKLMPLFQIRPRQPYAKNSMRATMHRLINWSGVYNPTKPDRRNHFIRATVDTELMNTKGLKEFEVDTFMSWASDKSRMVRRYNRIDKEKTDKKVLQHHPIVKIWEDYIKDIVMFNIDVQNALKANSFIHNINYKTDYVILNIVLLAGMV